MSSRLAERLDAERHRQFVGRGPELVLFRAALTADKLPYHVLYLYGPGGVGKTTLLREYARLAEQAGVPALVLDGRHIEPSPAAFLDALRRGLALPPDASPLDALAAAPVRRVILIDTYETLAPLDGWLRESCLPQLTDNILVVLAGRRPPSHAWLGDAGWARLLRPLALGDLTDEESREYLARRGLPPEQRAAVLDFAHGHPLALSLVADVVAQNPDSRFHPDAAPDLVKALVRQFVEQTPSGMYRAALEAAAIARTMNEPLLSAMLDIPDVHELFEWLRGLSFMEVGAQGLFPHDLAREALAADLRWRDPDADTQLQRRAGRYLIDRLQRTSPAEHPRLLSDFMYLHRDHAALRSLLQWREDGTFFADEASEVDIPALVAMVERHEGTESARWAEHWLRRQWRRAVVYREAGAGGGPEAIAGFLLRIALHEASPKDLEADPGTRCVWCWVQAHAPLRSGEAATLRRFGMARDTYQSPSTVFTLAMVDFERHVLTTPNLGPVFAVMADPEFWAPLLSYAGLARIAEADFRVGGHDYGVFGLDMRAVSPLARLRFMNERDTTDATVAVAAPVVLDRPAFEVAVKAALRSLAQPDTLHGNPLLASRLVTERAGVSSETAQRVDALRSLIVEVAEALRGAPRSAKAYRALDLTYLRPSPSQEVAAERLGLPFSTYRRHLQSGIQLVTDALWQREIGGSAK